MSYGARTRSGYGIAGSSVQLCQEARLLLGEFLVGQDPFVSQRREFPKAAGDIGSTRSTGNALWSRRLMSRAVRARRYRTGSS